MFSAVLPTGGSDGAGGYYSIRRYVGSGLVRIKFDYTGISIRVYHSDSYSMAYLHIISCGVFGVNSKISEDSIYGENTVFQKHGMGIIIKPVDGRWGMFIDIVAVQGNSYSVNFNNQTDTSSWNKLL